MIRIGLIQRRPGDVVAGRATATCGRIHDFPRWFLGLLMLCTLVASASAGPWYDERIQLRLVPGADIADINAEYGTATLDLLPPLFLVSIPDGVPQEQILIGLRNDARVEWAEPAYLDETPEGTRQMIVIIVGGTVTEYQDQDVLTRIHLDDILDHTTGSGVVMAVLDTGVDPYHPALYGSLLEDGIDFVDDDLDPSDSGNGLDDDGDGAIDEGRGHGTMVAGIAHLVAPDAQILPVRILDDEGRGDSFDVAKGIVYAVDHGAQVINMSFGLPLTCETIAFGVEYAAAAGVTLVSAAGNDGVEFPPYYPASDPAVLSVASVDSSDVKSTFSNYHPTVALSAPGDGILAPFPGGQYAVGAGTSFSAPFVSGQAALVRSGLKAFDETDLDPVIRKGVVDIDHVPGNEPFAGKLGSGRFDGLETWLAIAATADVPEPGLNASAWRAQPNPSSGTQPVLVRARDGETGRSGVVLDISGRLVARLSGSRSTFGWDGRDLDGRPAPAGFYQVRIETSSGWETIPLLRTR